MEQNALVDRLQKYFGSDKTPFVEQTAPFDHILPRALALLLCQGNDPSSPALLNRLRPMDWSGGDSSTAAARVLDNASFFQGLSKRAFFSARRFLQAVAEDQLNLDELCHCQEETILEALLAIKGIGPDTAEAMVLYSFNKPFIPVNSGLYRIANRHGGVPESPEREEIRHWFHGFFPEEPGLIRQAHTHILAVAKRFCKASAPLCAGCPLHDML